MMNMIRRLTGLSARPTDTKTSKTPDENQKLTGQINAPSSPFHPMPEQNGAQTTGVERKSRGLNKDNPSFKLPSAPQYNPNGEMTGNPVTSEGLNSKSPQSQSQTPLQKAAASPTAFKRASTKNESSLENISENQKYKAQRNGADRSYADAGVINPSEHLMTNAIRLPNTDARNSQGVTQPDELKREPSKGIRQEQTECDVGKIPPNRDGTRSVSPSSSFNSNGTNLRASPKKSHHRFRPSTHKRKGAFIWPKGGRKAGMLGRLKDVITGRGPDIYIAVNDSGKAVAPFNWPTEGRWSGWGNVPGVHDDEIMCHDSDVNLGTIRDSGRRKPLRVYNYRTRRYVDLGLDQAARQRAIDAVEAVEARLEGEIRSFSLGAIV